MNLFFASWTELVAIGTFYFAKVFWNQSSELAVWSRTLEVNYSLFFRLPVPKCKVFVPSKVLVFQHMADYVVVYWGIAVWAF